MFILEQNVSHLLCLPLRRVVGGGGVRRDWPCLKSSLVKGRVRKVWIKGGQFKDAARVAGTLVIFVNL